MGIAKGYLSSKSQTITSDVVERVSDKYPNLSMEWLMRGIGDMFCSPSGDVNALYDVDASGGGNVIKGDGNHHNHQHGGGDAVKDKEIEMLKDKVSMQDKTIADKDEEIRFLRAMLQKQHNI